MRNPLVFPLIAIAAGEVAARYASFSRTELLLAISGLAVLSVLARLRGSRRLALACVLVAFIAGGAFLHLAHQPPTPPHIDARADEVVILSGCIVDPPVFSSDREQFTLELDRDARARVSLYVREGQKPQALEYGQLAEIDARLRMPKNYRNPGSFDYEGYLARRSVFWTASVVSGEPVRILPGSCGNVFDKAIFRLRTKALARIDELFPGDTYSSAMLQAILIGESAGLEKAWTEHFRRTGTYHALVISGLHVSVLAGVLLLLLRLLMLGELPSLAITAVAAWLYAFVSGAQVPVTRAAAGFTLFLIARYFYRQSRILNLIAAVAIGFLLYDPYQLFEASFQLSFLSIAAIAVIAVPIVGWCVQPFARGAVALGDADRDLHLEARVAAFRVEMRLLAETAALWLRVPFSWTEAALGGCLRLFYYLVELAVISASVQAGLILPMVYYFHRVSLSGLSANLLVVPLMSAVVPVGFLAIFTGWGPAAWTAKLLLQISAWVVDRHASWEPGIRIPDPPAWLALAFTAALVIAVWPGRLRLVRVVPATALLAVVLWHPFVPNLTPGQMELTAIDVGQGESLFLALPSGKLMLMDGGGIPVFGKRAKPRLDIGEDVVSPYLWSRSIRRVDVIAMSHAHDDHMGGIPALIENFRPAELWTASLPESARSVREAAKRFGTRIVVLAARRTIEYGGVSFQVLSPPADYAFSDTGKNDESLVMRVAYGSHTFLLTGDIESRMEQALLDTGPGRINVLKVAHHGSKTSTAENFIEATQPQFAIVSAGTGNPYRHPNTQVLKGLSEHHAAILRTDLAGLITIRSDGRRFTLDTARWSGSAQSVESAF